VSIHIVICVRLHMRASKHMRKCTHMHKYIHTHSKSDGEDDTGPVRGNGCRHSGMLVLVERRERPTAAVTDTL